jgi:adhesin HecA-like repeat protein
VSFAVSSPLDSVTNQSGGIIEAQDGATLVLDDLTINNGGTIELNGSSSTTQMTIEGTVTLGPFEVIASGQILSSDAGSVTLTDSSDNQIVSDGAAATLHIADNTISGAGTMGDADLTLDNDSGTIDATGVLAINAFTINNSGLLEATGGGSLQISGSGAGSTLANDGTLEANGGTVTLGGNVAISGTGSVTITGGGTANFQSFFSQNVTFSGGGTLELSHPGSFDPSGGTGSAISGFATGDTLDLQAYNAQAGDAFTVSASFDSGTNATTLTVTDPSVSNSDTQSITLTGDHSTATLAAANLGWSVTADSTGGVNVTEQPLPVVSLNQTSPVTTNENTALTLNTLSVSDTNAGDTLTVTLGVSDGTLTLGSATGLAGDSGLGTGSVTLTGTAAEIDTALASGVTYTPNSGFASTDSLVVDASDGTLDANQKTLAINVAAVTPTATPVAVSGVEGQAITLNLLPTLLALVNNDPNSLASLVISGLPAGAVLSDGTPADSFTASAGNGSIEIFSSLLQWDLSSLTVTPANAANFTLTIAATTTGATTATDTVAVTVDPEGPTGSNQG